MVTNGETEPRVGRRRLLRTAVNVGVSAVLVGGFGADYATPDDPGSIVYAEVRPERGGGSLEARTKEVPADWHESLRYAFEVQEQIRTAGLSSLVGSFVVPGLYDDPEASISVDATDESVREALGELVEGVAVDINVVDGITPRPESRFSLADSFRIPDPDDERVPGGVICEGSAMFGTLTPAMFDVGSQSRFFATSNHVYGASGTKETEHRGASLSLPHDGEPRRIGSVRRGYPPADIVQVTPAEDARPAPEIARASPSRVIGQYTKAGLADLMARGEKLGKVGALSDYTAGEIKGVDGVTCYTGHVCKGGQLKWGDERTMVDGDSGSVNFHRDPENPGEYVLIGGINNARTWWPRASFTWGTAAHHLLDEYGLHF